MAQRIRAERRQPFARALAHRLIFEAKTLGHKKFVSEPAAKHTRKMPGSLPSVAPECADATLQNYQIIAVHQFHPREFFGADFFRSKLCDATREFRSVQVTNPHDITRRKLAFATRDARRQ